MILTEQFINLCCVILFDDNPKFTESVVSEINFIISSYNEEDVAIQFRPKFQLTKTLVKLRLEKKSSEYIVDTILSGGHYSELESYIKGIDKRKLEGDKVQSAIDQISERRQTTFLSQDLPILEDFSKKLKSNAFTTAKEAIGAWSGIISKFHSRVLDQKRKEARAAIKELDLASDSYTDVINQIAVSYSGQNSVSTGYKDLNKLMNGGFEPTRLYIYGGTSGDGKSVLLANFLRNAVEGSHNSNNGPLNIYTYYTLENLIDESLVRLYCNIENEKVTDLITNFDEKRTKIERTLKEWQLDHHSIIVMSYFPPTLTSVSDLLSYSELIKLRYGSRAVLRATYVDYLDLLKSGQTFDIHRLEMGQVTIDMKVAAVMQGIPWISVTQLNRSICIYSRINIKGVGYTEFKNVKVGDEVENDQGFVKVKYVFPHEIKKCYKITTKSGKTIICGPKHNFPTTDGLKNIQYTGLKVGDKLYVNNRNNNQNKTMD